MCSINSFVSFAVKMSNVSDYECTMRPRVSTTKSHTHTQQKAALEYCILHSLRVRLLTKKKKSERTAAIFADFSLL